MGDAPTALGATNVRMTFRTYKTFVQKLRVVAQAHHLHIGRRLSLGAALNLLIGSYDASKEQAMVDSIKRQRKKGTKR
jgi:hypothetical protein